MDLIFGVLMLFYIGNDVMDIYIYIWFKYSLGNLGDVVIVF